MSKDEKKTLHIQGSDGLMKGSVALGGKNPPTASATPKPASKAGDAKEETSSIHMPTAHATALGLREGESRYMVRAPKPMKVGSWKDYPYKDKTLEEMVVLRDQAIEKWWKKRMDLRLAYRLYRENDRLEKIHQNSRPQLFDPRTGAPMTQDDVSWDGQHILDRDEILFNPATGKPIETLASYQDRAEELRTEGQELWNRWQAALHAEEEAEEFKDSVVTGWANLAGPEAEKNFYLGR